MNVKMTNKCSTRALSEPCGKSRWKRRRKVNRIIEEDLEENLMPDFFEGVDRGFFKRECEHGNELKLWLQALDTFFVITNLIRDDYKTFKKFMTSSVKI